MRLISAICLLVTLLSCKKEVTLKEIITNPDQPLVGDTLLHIALTKEKIDKTKYTWSVKDASGSEQTLLSHENNTMMWIGKTAGIYEVTVEGKRGSTKSSITQTITVSEDSASFFKTAIVGKWAGSAETNWGMNYTVEIEFFSNATYSAHSTTSGYVAFYYGVDADTPLKTYEVYPTNEPMGYGNIIVDFDGSYTYDELKQIEFSPDNNTLIFDFWHLGNYAITYTLSRQ